MLSNFTPVATVPTADMAKARSFYEETLGLGGGMQVANTGEVYYTCGTSGFLLYSSQFAGTNQATTMCFQLDDAAFDAEVASLRNAGIGFDTFELEGLTWVDGVGSFEGTKAVWFKDPDGNILNLTTMQG